MMVLLSVLLNYVTYREKRDPQRRREQNREAKRRQRSKQRVDVSRISARVSQSQPESAQAQAEADKPPVVPQGTADALEQEFDQEFWTGTGAGWNGTAGPAAQLGEWTHVAATFADEQKALYINGRLVGESSAPLALNTERPLRIGGGATEGPGNYFFGGMIDEVRLYNRALPAEEVAGLAGRTQPLHKSF